MAYWDAIGAIGEVLGALGVMATLVYLSIQTKQTGRMVRAQTTHQMSESIREVMLAFTDREFSEAIMGIDDNPQPHEELMTVGWVFAATRAVETQYYLHKEGIFDAEIWAAWCKQIPYIYRALRPPPFVHQSFAHCAR